MKKELKASDLRMNNLVQYKDTKEVTHIYHLEHRYKDVYRINDVIDNDTLEPIPLTEQWLIKFGFERGELICQKGNGQDWQPEYPKTYYRDYVKNGLCYQIGEFHWKDYNGTIKKDAEESILYNNNSLGIEIKFLHQLQNLYFALTGNDLTLKD